MIPEPDVIRDLVAHHGAPLLLLSPSAVRTAWRRLAAALPGVELHYALKPLPHPAMIATIAAEGGRFDCCSAGEIELVRSGGISPEHCIHTHPIKREADIRAGLDFGIDTFVCDNRRELDKFEPFRDRVRLLLRLSFRSSDAAVDLSYKFGIAPDLAHDLLLAADRLGLQVAGLCFHVGSQCQSPARHIEAIGFCRRLFNLAALDGIALDTLDIGGGFPVPYTAPVLEIGEFCAPIARALEDQFAGLRIIAEPGRFIAAPALCLAASVMGWAERSGLRWYYLDDGLYGSFSGKLFDHCDYPIHALADLAGEDRPRHRSVLAGPTCDSVDVLYEHLDLPELDVGDLVVAPMMGAYTHASATEFNHFAKTRIVVAE